MSNDIFLQRVLSFPTQKMEGSQKREVRVLRIKKEYSRYKRPIVSRAFPKEYINSHRKDQSTQILYFQSLHQVLYVCHLALIHFFLLWSNVSQPSGLSTRAFWCNVNQLMCLTDANNRCCESKQDRSLRSLGIPYSLLNYLCIYFWIRDPILPFKLFMYLFLVF